MSGWSDYDVDWSSAEKLRTQATSEVFAALSAAVAERFRAARYIFLGSEQNPLTIPLDPLKPEINATAYIDSNLSNAIPHMADHTVGDYSVLRWPTLWTEDSLADALEYDAILGSQQLNDLHEWAWQKYQIINQLRWGYFQAFIFGGTSTGKWRIQFPGSEKYHDWSFPENVKGNKLIPSLDGEYTCTIVDQIEARVTAYLNPSDFVGYLIFKLDGPNGLKFSGEDW